MHKVSMQLLFIHQQATKILLKEFDLLPILKVSLQKNNLNGFMNYPKNQLEGIGEFKMGSFSKPVGKLHWTRTVTFLY